MANINGKSLIKYIAARISRMEFDIKTQLSPDSMTDLQLVQELEKRGIKHNGKNWVKVTEIEIK